MCFQNHDYSLDFCCIKIYEHQLRVTMFPYIYSLINSPEALSPSLYLHSS